MIQHANAKQTPGDGHAVQHGGQGANQDTRRGAGRSTDLRDSPMMVHLLDALDAGTDIGHYGRLSFTMVARFFLPADEIVTLLAKQPDVDETEAKALLLDVQVHDYNPPRRSQIVQWQRRQDFPICPDADNPRACNVYDELRFPDSVYDHIQRFYEEQVEAREHEAQHDAQQGPHPSA
jgi:hypothetical protein